MDHRGVKAGGAVRDPPVGRASPFSRFHHPQHLAEEGILRRGRCDDAQGSGQVQRARPQHGANRRRERRVLSGHQRDIQFRNSLDHRGIYRHALAGRQHDGRP